MGGRAVVLAGLLAGVATAGLALVLLALGGPGPVLPEPAASTAPSPSGASTAPSPTPAPSATAAAGATADLGDAAWGIGLPALELRLRTLAGTTIDLADLRGRAVWVVFTATWCPSCRDDASTMNRLLAEYRDRGLAVLAVDVREDPATVQAFASSTDPTYELVLDTDGSTARRWGAVVLPTHLFVDPDGIVRGGAVGTLPDDLVATRIEELLPPASPSATAAPEATPSP